MPEIRTSTPYNYENNQPPAPSGNGTSTPPPQNQQPDNSEDQSDEQNNRFTKARNIISAVSLFLAAPLFALVLILFVIQSYEVDGPSMQETLHDNDLLIVSKIPKTISRLTGNAFIPPRYDIIIFSKDESFGLGGQSRQLVKRVIGLPGERVVVNDGTVTVYNAENPDGFNPDENKEYSQTIQTTPGNVDVTVPEGQLFVMGDNRTNSLDSRSFGPISYEDIVGELSLRLFPLNKAQTF